MPDGMLLPCCCPLSLQPCHHGLLTAVGGRSQRVGGAHNKDGIHMRTQSFTESASLAAFATIRLRRRRYRLSLAGRDSCASETPDDISDRRAQLCVGLA